MSHKDGSFLEPVEPEVSQYCSSFSGNLPPFDLPDELPDTPLKEPLEERPLEERPLEERSLEELEEEWDGQLDCTTANRSSEIEIVISPDHTSDNVDDTLSTSTGTTAGRQHGTSAETFWNSMMASRSKSISPEEICKSRLAAVEEAPRHRARGSSLFKMDLMSAPIKSSLMTEMESVLRLRHNNLIQYYGYAISPTFKPVLVYEYVEGSLQQIIHNPTIMLDQEILMSITKNIANVMRYLHSHSPVVVHGNLISSSILVDSNLNIKVADLVKCGRRPSTYNPPEVASGAQPDTKSDVWFFGLLLYELFTRKAPFESIMSARDEMSRRGSQPPAQVELPILHLTDMTCSSAVVRNICRSCQAVDPQARPTFQEITKQLSQLRSSTLATKMNQLLEKNRLLHDILPEHVAAPLSSGRKVKPEVYEDVTLFFSDIVGFTTISQKLQPIEVMNLLDRLYGRFDGLTKKHELFKVETIGDAYMCAGNLLSRQSDHSLRVVKFAKDTIAVAKETIVHPQFPEMGCVNIRVGLHSGPLVASVVGKTNPRYCLFGDTVNTASRMESNSERNCIHVSASTALKLVEVDCMRLIPRGHIPIKGKGEMETFWLRGYAPPEVSMSFSNPSSMHPSRQGSLALSAGPGPLDSFSDISARSGT
uniref:guanylate cyclase n=1 Tax=Pyramimonas obovata TaxID=1411642 RepID=A0A7S0MUX4_9CHLO